MSILFPFFQKIHLQVTAMMKVVQTMTIQNRKLAQLPALLRKPNELVRNEKQCLIILRVGKFNINFCVLDKNIFKSFSYYKWYKKSSEVKFSELQAQNWLMFKFNFFFFSHFEFEKAKSCWYGSNQGSFGIWVRIIKNGLDKFTFREKYLLKQAFVFVLLLCLKMLIFVLYYINPQYCVSCKVVSCGLFQALL